MTHSSAELAATTSDETSSDEQQRMEETEEKEQDEEKNNPGVVNNAAEQQQQQQLTTAGTGSGTSADETNHSSSSNSNSNDDGKNESTSTSFSLNSKFGHRVGRWQSLSLILNAGLMVYAHVGLSAVMFSSIQRIEDQISGSGSSSSSSSSSKTSSSSTSSSEGSGSSNNLTNSTTAGNNATVNPDDETPVFVATGACDELDYIRWTEQDGLTNKITESNYCARTEFCLVNVQCNADCFVNQFGYSTNCAMCFGELPLCSLNNDCGYICQNDGFSDECQACTKPCNDIFFQCTGLPRELPTLAPTPSSTNDSIGNNNTTNNGNATFVPTAAPTTSVATMPKTSSTNQEEETSAEICERQQAGMDYEDVDQYYNAYEIQFFRAIKTAWTSDARLLAVIVMIFSGIWPYAKNVILMLAWYLKLSETRRSWILKWLRRLGKYTLVDVYIVILLLIGVIIQVNLGGGTIPVFIRGEPRPAIVAFLVATLWEFVHIEWMTHCHVEIQRHEPLNPLPNVLLQAMRFRTGLSVIKKEDEPTAHCKNPVVLRVCMCLLLAVAVVLFVAGSAMEVVRFTTILGGETDGCVRSYNLYELGTVWVSDYFLYDNSAKGGTWTLYMAYVLFVLAIPMFVHLVHILVFVGNMKNRMLCRAADMLWTFSSVEVLMLGVFTVQYKFDDLVANLAGNDGAEYFGVTSALGPGFFVLIAYSVVGGCVHYFFNSAVTEYYRFDPHFQIDAVWTKLCGCVMDKDDSAKPRGKALIHC